MAKVAAKLTLGNLKETRLIYGSAQWNPQGMPWKVVPNKQFLSFLERHHVNLQPQNEAYSSQVLPHISSIHPPTPLHHRAAIDYSPSSWPFPFLSLSQP